MIDTSSRIGHHTQEDFNKSAIRCCGNKKFILCCSDTDTMNKTLARQIGQWVLERGVKINLKERLYLTTLKNSMMEGGKTYIHSSRDNGLKYNTGQW